MAKGAWIFGVDVVGKAGRPKGSAKVACAAKCCKKAKKRYALWICGP